MSSSEAQKSPMHATTEDSTTEPSAADARAAKARPEMTATVGASPGPRPQPDNDIAPTSEIAGGPGAGAASSGGGAGAGIPGGGTDMRTDGAFSGGDVKQDREKLFPDARTHRTDAPGTAPRANPPRNDDTRVGTDRDESTYGGPLNLDDPDNV